MADDFQQHRPRFNRQPTHPAMDQNHSLNQRPSVPNIYTHAQSTTPTSNTLLKKRHSALTLSTSPSASSPPLHFPVPPPLPDLRSMINNKSQQNIVLPGGAPAMPLRPPRHPGREREIQQQQGGALPMNVRIPSSASSIASNTVPPSPASIASSAMSSFQNQNQQRRATSHSNLKKKSFVIGGSSSRPGTADSAMTSSSAYGPVPPSATSSTREREWGGSSAGGNTATGVINEDDRDDEEEDYGNTGSYSYLEMRGGGGGGSHAAQQEKKRVEVTPWEFQALPEESAAVLNSNNDLEVGPGSSNVVYQQQQHRPRSIKTSRVSASSVPPPPVPPMPSSPMPMSAGSGANASVFSIPHSASAASTTHSMKTGARVVSPSVATGPMDEVTPWDMYPVGVTNVNTSNNSVHTPTSTKAPSSFSHNLSSANLPMSSSGNHSSVNLNSPVTNTKIIAPLANVVSPSVATGPMDEVTPWDMYPVPEGGSSSLISGGGSGTGVGERERAGSASIGSGQGILPSSGPGGGGKEEKEKKRGGGTLGKIKAAVKNAASGASGGGEMKKQRRGSSSAASGAGTIASGTSWASGSGTGSGPGGIKQGQGSGGMTPTAYNTTFFPQPVPPGIPLPNSRKIKPTIQQQQVPGAGNRNPSNSFSSATSGSTTSSVSTSATTPPNTPPLPSPHMVISNSTSSSSLSPTRAYFVAHSNHSAHSAGGVGNANGGGGVTGSPRTTTTTSIYHSPSTSTLGSVLSRESHGSAGKGFVGEGIRGTGSVVDLSLASGGGPYAYSPGHPTGQYTPTQPTSAVHKKQSLMSTKSSIGGSNSMPPTPLTASSTAFSTSTVSHSQHSIHTPSTMSVSSGAVATATGPVEDVTPWEMYPAPAHTVMAPPPPPISKDGMSTAKKQQQQQRPRAGTVGSVVSAFSGKSGKSQSGVSNGAGGGGSPNPNVGNNANAYIVQSQVGDGSVGGGVGVALGGPGPIPSAGASRKSLPYSERSGASSGYYKQQYPQHTPHSQQQYQPTTPPAKTGPTEEVTPWELEDTLPVPNVGLVRVESGGASTSSLPGSLGSVPAPNIHPAAASSSSSGLGAGVGSATTRARGSMTLEQLEEVMPWELSAPPPPSSPLPSAMSQSQGQSQSQSQYQSQGQGQAYSSSGEETGVAGGGLRERKSFKMPAPVENQPHHGKQSMQSTVSALHRSTFGNNGASSGSAFADFGLRRRRSTGGGTANSKSGLFGKEKESKDNGKDRKEKLRLSIAGQGGNHAILPAGGMGPASSSTVPSGPSSASLTTTSATSIEQQPQQGQKTPKFSTADRAILEQLKANLRARDAQFVIKGVGHTTFGQLKSPGKRYHAHPKEEVPYPRSYERQVLDLDVWETMFSLDVCQSLTWHVFETPPTKVLELGCGTGTWILQCARTWKECHFVGLDIVPLHPNLQNVGSPDLASRITWVHHNFLETLPFQDEEFDFVHIRRIALGVPEDKWDKLFEEIARVMKPGAAFEMIEEDLFFPGRRNVDDNDESISIMYPDGESSSSLRNSLSSDQHHNQSSINGHDDVTVHRLPLVVESDSPQTPTKESHIIQLPPHPSSPTQISYDEHSDTQSSSRPPSVATFTPPQPSTLHRPSLSVKTQNAATSSNNYSNITTTHPPAFSANVGLFGGIGYLASQDPFMEAIKQQKRDRASVQPEPSLNRAPSFSGTATITPAPKTKISPFLIRSTPNDDEPTDPRDHAILAAVWTGMLESRFINTTPLSLLTTYLEYHFKDVRTHPPLLYTYPPVAPKIYPPDEDDDEPWIRHPPNEYQAHSSELDTDDARDAVIPMPNRPLSNKSRKSVGSDDNGGEIAEDDRWLSLRSLIKKSSPYVSLDESRSYAYGPSSVSLPTKNTKDGKAHGRRVTNLPNTTLNIDLRTLNLHLTLRAREIIACSEEMWEWVVAVQAAEKLKNAQENEALRSGSLDGFNDTLDSASISSSLDFTNAAILEMTRDDFDLLLNNFDMDMQDRSSLGPVLKERFEWDIFPTIGVLPDRKAYDKACRKFDRWLSKRPKNGAGGVIQQPSDNHRRFRGLVPSTGLVPPTPETPSSYNPSVISRSTSAPQPSNGTQSVVEDYSRSSSTTLSGTSNEQDNPPPFSPSSVVPPPRPTSRAMRVFIAWKAT